MIKPSQCSLSLQFLENLYQDNTSSIIFPESQEDLVKDILPPLHVPESSFTSRKYEHRSLVRCPQNYYVHNFLSTESYCGMDFLQLQ